MLVTAVAAIVVLDRLLKALAFVSPSATTVPLVDGILSFGLEVNTTGPLGLPLAPVVPMVVAAVFLCLVPILWSQLAVWDRRLVLVLSAGVIANAYDRFCFGYIIDTLHLTLPSLPSLTFNVADLLIIVGVFGLIVRQFPVGYAR